MEAMTDDDRGDPPFIFPNDKPLPADCDDDGDIVFLNLDSDGSPRGWNYRKPDSLKHNDIWHPLDCETMDRLDGAVPMPSTATMLALRGE